MATNDGLAHRRTTTTLALLLATIATATIMTITTLAVAEVTAAPLKLLRYPSPAIKTRRVSIKRARAFKVPKVLRVRAGKAKLVGAKIALEASVDNPSKRPIEIIVFPVHGAHPLHLQLSDRRVRPAPSTRPPIPPRPPSPLAIVLPARTTVVFAYAIDLRDYHYLGRPKVMLVWTFHYWNAPKPRGAQRLKLPAHPGQRPAPNGKRAYPLEWISKARSDNRFTCGGLVYKRGCALLRRGEMVFGVTLRASGAVRSLKRKSTTIRVDPKLVERCIRKTVGKWRFTAPAPNMTRTFEMRFVLADKC
jgi:hypothetical protein